jgi:hypothetical protein
LIRWSPMDSTRPKHGIWFWRNVLRLVCESDSSAVDSLRPDCQKWWSGLFHSCQSIQPNQSRQRSPVIQFPY